MTIESILEREGKKQQKIMKFCYTMMKKDLDAKLYLAYADRYLKAGKRKVKIIMQIKDLNPSFFLDDQQF